MSETCFVIMPFGTKSDTEGKSFAFDDVYEYLIKEAISQVEGVEPLRCDEISQGGWIHSMMIENIAEAPLAIVDISTLNPNVFYELGVRHSLKSSGTVLIRRAGTDMPFNIEGFNCIEYIIGDAEGRSEFIAKLRNFLENTLAHPESSDSLVYEVLPDLKIVRESTPAAEPYKILQRTETFSHPLKRFPEKQICLVTGDWRDITMCDVWVNSENTNMQMARFYDRSISGMIRYLGASKSLAGEILEDSIAMGLAEALAGAKRVEKSTVIPTGPGQLAETNQVKALFHVASVEGELGIGYRPIGNIGRCVRNVLKMADSTSFKDQQLQSILFPIMGAGTGGGELADLVPLHLNAAVQYLESNPDSCISSVYFSAFTDIVLDLMQTTVKGMPSLG